MVWGGSFRLQLGYSLCKPVEPLSKVCSSQTVSVEIRIGLCDLQSALLISGLGHLMEDREEVGPIQPTTSTWVTESHKTHGSMWLVYELQVGNRVGHLCGEHCKSFVFLASYVLIVFLIRHGSDGLWIANRLENISDINVRFHELRVNFDSSIQGVRQDSGNTHFVTS